MAKNGFSMSKRVTVEQITDSKTLTVDDCGKHFVVDTGNTDSAIRIITLPTVADAESGWNTTIHFVSGSKAGTFFVESPAANIDIRTTISATDEFGLAASQKTTVSALFTVCPQTKKPSSALLPGV